MVNDGQPIELGYWSWGDESTDPVISMLREYEKIHPNVTFKISQVAWSDYWVKTPLSLKGNKNAPVLFNVHNSEDALLRPHAVRLDGASDWRIFRQVVLPMSRNSIAALAIFTFLWNWEDYLWPFLMITDDDKQLLSVGLKMFSGQYGTDYGGLFAATSVTITRWSSSTWCSRSSSSPASPPALASKPGRFRPNPNRAAVSHQSRGAAAASLVSS